MQKIINVNYGLSSVYSDGEDSIIEMNYKLTDSLREKIKKHEMRHGVGRYDKNDFKNDFASKKSYFFESVKFCFYNIECWINFMPYLYSYYFKEMSFNKSAMIPFAYFGVIFSLVCSLVISFTLKSNFLKTLFFSLIAYFVFVALINLILLGITHWRVKRQKWFIYKEVLE